MASGGKRGGSGERVLEGRHVIGLFVLMLLFSGVFFTLGYVMGRNQYDGQVRTVANPHGADPAAVNPKVSPKTDSKYDPRSGHAEKTNPAAGSADPTAPPYSEWEFYHAGEANKANERLKSAEGAPKPAATAAKSAPPPKPAAAAAKGKPHTVLSAPLIPGGAYVLQVAALTKEADALVLAETLQKKKFPAYVLTPGADKFYRVQVGPYADQRAAGAAKQGLENAGFKAIVKH